MQSLPFTPELAGRIHGRSNGDSQLAKAGLDISTEPEPLRRPLPPPQPYPMHALGDVLGAAAESIRSVVCAPAAMVGQSLLAAASLSVQAHADVLIHGRREPLGLWCLTIGASGERKSVCDHWALAAHREHERKALQAYRLEKAQYEIELQAYEAVAHAAKKGKGNDSGAIEHELSRLGPVPEAPLKPLMLMSAPTIEGIHRQYMIGHPSIGLFHDDAGEFLGGHAMSAEHRVKTASGLSKLWDNGEFDRVRAGDGAEKHYGKRMALHLMLQPVIAETVLSDDVLTGQGFLARCLMSWPASTIGTRTYVAADLSADGAVLRYWQVMRELLERQPTLRPETRNELEPRTLVLPADAEARWVTIHNAIEEEMADAHEYAGIRAWASKAPAQVLRIAGVLTLVSDPDAGVIRTEAIDRAAVLVDHYLAEAVRIVGTHSVPKSVRDAEALLDWCHAERISLLHSRAALQFGPGVIRTRQVFDQAISELERTGWVHRIEDGAVVDGAHRRRVWTIRSPK